MSEFFLSFSCQIFVSSRSFIQNPYAEFHHFWGVKSAALTFYSTPQTVAKLLPEHINCKCRGVSRIFVKGGPISLGSLKKRSSDF